MLNDPIITERTIFARNCRVEKIPRNVAETFLDANHIYGSAACRYCYGLFVKRATGVSEKKYVPESVRPVDCSMTTGELVAVACFSNARRWEKDGRSVCSYEWVRYASLCGSRVVGGMGKLLSAFVAEHHPDDVMTYAISTIAPGRPVRSVGVERHDGSEASDGSRGDFNEDSGGCSGDDFSEEPVLDFGNAFRKLGFVEESRRTFPSRLVDGETSLSIKFRLKLTY